VNARAPLFLIGLVGLVLLVGLGGGYSWYWGQLADGIEVNLKIWLGQRRAEGFQAEAGPITVSGFPFDIVATIDQAELGRGAAGTPQAWHWQGRALKVRLAPLEPTRIHISTTAGQTVRFSDNRGQTKTVRLQADRADGLIEIGDDGRLARVQADFGILALSGSALPAPVAARHLTVEARPAGAAANFDLGLSLQVDELHLPMHTDPILGDIVDVAHLDLTISGPPPLRWTAPVVSAWRDNGGTVEINRARIKWGALDTTASGTLTLDQRMRPLFSATGGLKDYDKTITAYKKAGLITPLNAAALTIALNMLRRDAEGRTTIAVSGQDGLLKVGPMTVARLKPVAFPRD